MRFIITILSVVLISGLAFLNGTGGCGGGSNVDPVAPVVVSTDPVPDEAGVRLKKLVIVAFSKEMDPATIGAETFYVSDDEAVVAGTIVVNGTAAVFTPAEGFQPDTVYTVTATTAIKDIEGVNMESDYQWNFTTALCDKFFSMELDAAFGTEGKFSFDNANKVDIGNAMVVQDDGKIVVSGYTGLGKNGHDADLLLIRLDQNGDLDPTFGTGGVVEVPCDSFWGIQWWAQQGLALQSDGKIVVGGDCQMKASMFRLNTDGSTDDTFGTKGRVDIASNIAGGNWSAVFSLAMQPDGAGGEKIIMGGIANRIISWDVEPVWILARLNADGSVDNTFGDQAAHPGIMIEDWGTLHDDGIRALLVLSDRKIIAYGNYDAFEGTALYTHFAAARYDADGVLDTTFGAGDDDGVDGLAAVVFTDHDWAYPIALTPDGKLVGGAHINCCWDGSDTAVFRLTSDGILDTAFGTEGKVVVDMSAGHQDFGNAIVVLKDGTLIVGGYANNGDGITNLSKAMENDDFGFAMLDVNGNLVEQFGDDGLMRTDFYGDADGINSMALFNETLQSFELLAAGATVEPPRTDSDFAVAKYKSVPVEVCPE